MSEDSGKRENSCKKSLTPRNSWKVSVIQCTFASLYTCAIWFLIYLDYDVRQGVQREDDLSGGCKIKFCL